ncbi:MAG: ATP-binding protein [Shimia sp.]
MSQPSPDALAALMQALPIPALAIDTRARIAGLNAQAQDLFGTDPVGRHYTFAIRQPGLARAIDGALYQGTTGEARYTQKAGEQEHLWAGTASTIHLDRTPYVLLTLQDVGMAEGVGQLRRDFVANVSHELKTPLTALIGFIETLRGSARDDARARDHFLEMMATEAGRMDRLVKDLLSLSRVETDERIRPQGAVDLVELLGHTAMSLAPIAGDRGAQVVLDITTETASVQGDNDQLLQVFSNLVENAVKYGAQRVTVSLRALDHDPAMRGPAWLVDVIDDGQGIDPIHVPRLTERFYRVDSHRSRAQGGTGLGLAIVKHIVGRHRGRLRIASVPGEGSTFSVLLPQ